MSYKCIQQNPQWKNSNYRVTQHFQASPNDEQHYR